MADLKTNVRQANADFQAVKNKIIENGVEVSEGTPTADYASKVDEVFEAGIRATWEALQAGGTKTDIVGQHVFFGANFSKKTYKPICDIRPASAYLYYNNCPNDVTILLTEGQVIMKELEEEQGMVHDFSGCASFAKAFTQGLFSELNVIDMSKATDTQLAFYGGYLSGSVEKVPLKLKRIERLIFSEITTFAANMFSYNSRLEYIGFEGVIAQGGLDVSSCVILDKESHIKLVNILSDTTSGLSVTVSDVAVNKAFETSAGENDGSSSAEWTALINSKPNWTIKLA